MERRLAVILAADVVGYSRMMGADEAGAPAASKALRTELVAPVITGHRGRDIYGDGVDVVTNAGTWTTVPNR